MNGDVNIERSFACSFGLLLLIITVPTAPGKSIDYCPRRCLCEHAQLVCGGARVSYSTKRIAEIPAKLDEITSRVEIGNFSRNLITEINFGDLFGLEVTKILDLSHNRIKTIENGAFEMTTLKNKLRVLYLSYNRLDVLQPEMFSGLDNLWQLYIGHNKLHVIANNAFVNMQELHMISLRNALSHWDFSTRPLTSLKHLKMVYLAQTNTTSCSCGLRHFIDDVISIHIDVIDELEANKYCSSDDVTCSKKSTLYTNVTPDLLDVELFELEDLVPAVSPNGIITYEGRSYSLYVPEGKRLLMMYDMDMRRKIASIQQPAVRADYERRFRLNMRGMIDRIYYEKETPHTENMETEFSTNGLSKETTAIRLRLQTTQATWAAGLEQLELQRSTEANYLQGKHPIQPSSGEKLKLAPPSGLDVGILLALSLGSVTIFFFLLAILLALTLRTEFRSKVDQEKSDGSSSYSGCTRLCEKITSKLAIRKQFIDKRGSSSSPKKGFSSLHDSAKETFEEKRRLKSMGGDPLPEDAIQALTREQRRRSLGGQSRASSEITGFDSDSDSDQELFHESYFSSR
ncbi:uncharacterized protein [Apostichopus japonicus]|uniref:uncharacterized protein n=1 Tax=Stichopus japonicus TaxID=307972 RepID=UPI003AB7EAE4